MLFSRTSNQQYVHLPKARPDDAASGEAPKSSIERRQLLENFLDLQVLELNGVTPPLYKFIDCKTLSRADCLQLSQWLEAAIGRNVNLLADMQKEEISFVPTLNLLGVCKGEDAASLFGQASARGLKFGVEVSQQISKSVAQELYVVMTCPQSPVVSFNEGTPWHVEASRLNKTLQNCIHDCTTLRYVGGSQNMLSLLDRSVPEIWLEGNFKELPQFQENLLRVLSLGGVEKLSLESNTEALHQCFVDTVTEVNGKLRSLRGVHQIELLSSYSDLVENRKEIVAKLLSAEHVTDITLPDPSWMPDPSEIRDMQEKEHWLQLLQSLTFINNDKIDWLEPILQRNKQLALLATKGVAGVFTQVMSEQLLPGSQNAGITIDPLMKYLDEAFANTPTGRALPVLNKRIAAGGRREWLELNGLKIPTPDTLGTSALFKFIDGKTLSRKDSLDLSKWLEEAGGQNVGLLAAMQKKESSFVPTLNLMFSWNSKRVIDLLEQASASSMTFGVSVTDQLLEPIAQKLSDVMASPQSRVASFDDATVWQAPAPEGPRIRELLRECIRHCTKLQYVSGSPGVLSLLDSNVPEIWLRGRNYSTRGQEQFQTALQRILSVGGVAKLSWESGAQRLPSEESEKVAQAITEAVAKANATLPGERGVYQVQLSGYEGKDDDKHPTEKKVVVQLVAH